ncbi:hypothetical protein Tco_0273333 [Tanacetum coccineum]
MHHTTQDERLSKLKFVSKGEPKGEPKSISTSYAYSRKGSWKRSRPRFGVSCVNAYGRGKEKNRGAKGKKERHETLMIGKEVDNEVNEGFNDQIKLKLKAVETIPPAYPSKWEKIPEVTSYISGASEVPLGTNVDFEAPCSVLQVHDAIPTDQVISSPPTTTTYNPTKNPQQKHTKQLIAKARKRKKDSTKAILQKLVEHEKRLNDLSKTNVAKVIKESVQANMINEVKNKLPKLEPDIVSDFIQTSVEQLYGYMLSYSDYVERI